MSELLITVGSLLFYAAATAYAVWYGVALLDYCMDYANPLWKWRYGAAKRYTDNVKELEDWLMVANTAELEAKSGIMSAHYQEIAAKSPAFKRWICVYCLSTFTGIFVASTVSIIILSLYGWWTILYWLSVFPVIGFIGSKN